VREARAITLQPVEGRVLTKRGERDGTKRLPAEFQRRVVDLVEERRKVPEVAAELGISEQTIYT
jgi:transposase-like protein